MDARTKPLLEIGRDIPTPGEIGRLIAAAEPNARMHALLRAAALCGLRASELRGLRASEPPACAGPTSTSRPKSNGLSLAHLCTLTLPGKHTLAGAVCLKKRGPRMRWIRLHA